MNAIGSLEHASNADTSPDSSSGINAAVVGVMVIGIAFLLFAANDNMFGGGKEPDDDDDVWENLKKLFNVNE